VTEVHKVQYAAKQEYTLVCVHVSMRGTVCRPSHSYSVVAAVKDAVVHSNYSPARSFTSSPLHSNALIIYRLHC